MGCDGIQVQPGCCCNVAYDGFDNWYGSNCLNGSALLNALDPANIGNLSQYKILFLYLGGRGVAGTYYNYTSAQRIAIKNWLIAGGRLIVTATPQSTFDAGDYSATTPNMDRLNSFLGYLGSSMQMVDNPDSASCEPPGCNAGCAGNYVGTVSAQPIVTGLPSGGVRHLASGAITAGVELCSTDVSSFPCDCDPATVFFAGEYIGSGIVFLGVSALFPYTLCGSGVDPSNCELMKRICNWKVSDMLE